MHKRDFMKAALVGAATLGSGAASAAKPAAAPVDDRAYMAGLLEKIASPVLSAMSKGQLKKAFPLELSPTWDGRESGVAYLECFGRMISGLSPWLALPEDATAEGKVRKRLTEQALQSYVHAVDPASPDYLLWRGHGQALVDSAYFTQALLRAPKALWEPLDATTKKRIVEEIKGLRRVNPPFINWLLFAAMNEAFLLQIGEESDPMRLNTAVRKIDEWYIGDGWIKDGATFHFDYYGSFVMHPMMIQVLEVMEAHKAPFWKDDLTKWRELAVKRAQRYSEHLERFVSPEGTFPPFGRSLTYRTAVFQPLAMLALRKQLPAKLSEGQVRSALVAAHKAVFSQPSNFTKDSFLTIGFAGHNPALGDWYSNNGSMYITAEGFLALGLPASDSFWTAPAQAWTQKLAFSGQPFQKDYAVDY
ncbi:DUF2264 domain-containing protein [Caulobacter sp. Root1472]|uniref:DUF2264 domain-containing protein n=1 Tax=Caulobacter sp. Root1472 TaxID=1736470 RepID=UPI0006FBD56E|nr:DUF2264 domain-containing protein [Caulobacter sp. Root1472]KQZ17976.1 hypothetical protein ASD47_11020 [Caulobacter sp. Root1472]